MGRAIYKAKYENSWALVVGINAYVNTSPLGYACNDAIAMSKQLTERFAFPVENVTTLLDTAASLANIRSAMHSLCRKAEENDRVVVFYAGHGHTVPAYGREAGFLVPIEGRVDDTSTLLPWDDLVHTSRMIRAKHLLFIMDACYGGLLGMRAVAPGNVRFVRDMLSRYSRQFLTAGLADEVVADSGGPRNGHSVFTGHLLDALDGARQARDGVVSANAVMAQVYDRVTKDHCSQQTPHYGFLAGDGDFFFSHPRVETSPDSPKEDADVLVEVPPDLTAPAEVVVTPSLLEQIKDLLADRKRPIKLNDVVMRELRAAQQRLGEGNFSVQGFGSTGAEFAARLEKYEGAMGELLQACVLLGRWADEEQQSVVRQIVNVLAGQLETKGGSVLWLSLRSYPMQLAMYVGGIGAIEGDNYHSLRSLLATTVTDHRNRGASMPVIQSTVEAMLEVDQTDAFKAIPEFKQKYSPRSEYLYTRIQPVVEDILFLGNRYDAIFDRFELLYALCYVDLSAEGRGGLGWGPVGRFGWKCRRGGADNPFAVMIEEAKRAGDKWPPLLAGMFQGSYAHFAEVAARFKTGLLDKLQWY
jgi:hypothetical protein